MASSIQSLENSVNINERLLEAFGGSVEGWEWDGTVKEVDHAYCACGHYIRFAFPWVKGNQCIWTGSTCVENVPFIDQNVVGNMKAALENLKARKAAALRKARQAAKTAEVVALKSQIESIITKRYGHIINNRANGSWMPPDQYQQFRTASWYLYKVRSAMTLKTAAGQRKRLNAVLQSLNAYTNTTV